MKMGVFACPDLENCRKRLTDINGSIQELEAQQVRIDRKAEAAHADIQLRSEAQRQCDILTAEISKIRVLAFVNDDGADVRELEKKLVEATKQLKAASTEADPAEHAIKILAAKSLKNADLMNALKKDLVEAERKWLKARQDILFEEFRGRFDQLHDTVAALLALEVHPSFDGPNSWTMVRPGSDLLGRLASALPYNGPRNYTPAWVHENNRFKFPGFEAAQEKLAEELLQTRPSSETVK